MGIKIKNIWIKYLVCVFTFITFLTGLKTHAQMVEGNISQTVRVAISNNGFKSCVYNQILIVATSDYTAYDKNTAKPIMKFSPSDVLKITMENGNLVFSVNNKIIAKNNGVIVLDCPKGLLGVENLKRNGKQALYHGTFEITPNNGANFYLINILDLQTYLKGVVPNEMPVRF